MLSAWRTCDGGTNAPDAPQSPRFAFGRAGKVSLKSSPVCATAARERREHSARRGASDLPIFLPCGLHSIVCNSGNSTVADTVASPLRLQGPPPPHIRHAAILSGARPNVAIQDRPCVANFTTLAWQVLTRRRKAGWVVSCSRWGRYCVPSLFPPRA